MLCTFGVLLIKTGANLLLSYDNDREKMLSYKYVARIVADSCSTSDFCCADGKLAQDICNRYYIDIHLPAPGNRGVTKYFCLRGDICHRLYEKYKSETKFYCCIVCDKVMVLRDLYKCAACKIERYCSRECQISHWQTHKPICSIRRLANLESSTNGKENNNSSNNINDIEDGM